MIPTPREPSPWSAIIAPHIIRYLLIVADERGVSLDRALRSVSLTREALDSPSLRVSYRQGREVIREALAAIDDPALGLTVGARQPLTATGVLGLAMLASDTLTDAVDVGMRFQNLVGSMVRWSAATEGCHLVLTVTVADDASPVERFLVEEAFAHISRMARESGDGATPEHIELVRPEPRIAVARRFTDQLSAPVRFGARRNAWLISRELADAPLRTADRWTRAEAIALLEAQTRMIVERQELVAVLAARIEDALPEVLPFSAHARELATSERTLRRRLGEVGAGYAEVLDEVRRSLVGRLLAQPDLTIVDISYRLGYTDERSLRRSVRRWFGMTPQEIRAAGVPQ